MARNQSSMLAKQSAYTAVSAAIELGELTRPSACEECGASCPSIYGHHEDYGRPLDVIWMCPKCHGKRHRIIRAQNRRPRLIVVDPDEPKEPDRQCPVCGWPVDQSGTRSPRLYHPACKKVRNYIDLAVAAAEAINPDQITARGIRGLFFRAGNRFRPAQLRDSSGRFVCGNPDTDT